MLKKQIYVGFCLVFCCFAAGCQSFGGKSTRVVVQGASEFPDSLAGRWQAEKYGWEIVLRPDGTISWARINLGRIKVIPGRLNEVPMKKGGTSVLQPGQWSVEYSAQQRSLAVEIIIERYHIELGDDVIEGKLRDVLVGKVSEDGEQWSAEWYSEPEYVVKTGEDAPQELAIDESDRIRGAVLFRKVEEQNNATPASGG